MGNPLVECIPNFSEGRRADVIEAIVTAIQTADAVRLLDVSSDADHNRSVVTFVGSPEAVEKAAYAGIKMAAQHIDLDQHRGEHPRMGATDVVPFVPIRDVTMADCVAIAQRLGKRVGEELNIPVYLYEAAATRPERENLENIRRGEYEGLKEAIYTDPARMPDFGPAAVSRAGATVIGARPPLIAFNVYLTTNDVEIANKIAKAVRFSNGGLRFVKALGLLVEGHAQVSMNLTNFSKTPIYRAVELIRREAQRYGVQIAYTELIGLTPEDALIDAARWYMQLDAFQPEQLLERRLESIPKPGPKLPEPPVPEGATVMAATVNGIPLKTPEPSLKDFLDEVAAGTPTPGGGAASALAGALAAALAAMVARLTTGRKKYAAAEAQMSVAATTGESLRRQLLAAMDEDISAFNALMDAQHRDKSDSVRSAAIQAALRRATDAPLRVMQLSREVLGVAHSVAEIGNANAATDAGVAAHMAMAAIEGAALNVRVNLAGLEDQKFADHLRESANQLINEARGLASEVQALVETRAGLK
jgi:glutamate formiminotransferase/formiminotetrahydrofolate cyclodeaminase